ncbi:hypothetical protein [Sedimenticola selenatireducens]|uniref:AsmA domain-containing protein n=1 Tax=Sedimenticola selenatireducens TaxID=191960 RepID=A0A558DVI0_9GAMM|nr:hypothetical protein [Sedimenticola selenatireducens]TVO77740.1 hypothetical protein FHP88_02765 [Sedimenticola selenatireducens]TVT65045.1 MAG: hypothetical protein FHK78_05130 [Sedimenticola selenatireducens]
MNSFKRLAIGLTTTLIVVIVGLYIFLSSNLGSLIVDAVESFGPKVTQSKVSLNSANIAITGEGELNGLVVGNPKGYKSDNAFELGAIKMVLDTDSLTSDVIRIKSILIESPKLNYEPGGDAGSNLKQLVNNVQQFAGSSTSSEEKSEKGKEKKLIIDLLSIVDGEVSVTTPLSDQPISTSLPNIELKDIGKKSGGTSSSDVVKLVIEKVTSAATNVGNISVDELKTKLQSQVGDKLKDVQSQIKAPEGLEGKTGEVGDKLKSIFK